MRPSRAGRSKTAQEWFLHSDVQQERELTTLTNRERQIEMLRSYHVHFHNDSGERIKKGNSAAKPWFKSDRRQDRHQKTVVHPIEIFGLLKTFSMIMGTK